MMQRMLKTADPTMVPTPTSPWVMKTPAQKAANHNHVAPSIREYLNVCYMYVPMTDAKSSGAELPAAMKVAPATSSLRSNFCMSKAKISSLNNQTSPI